MANYIISNGQLYNVGDLQHYGVKGMKWGVRKSVYKSMNRKQRRAQREKYWQSPEGKAVNKAITNASVWGTVLGGIPGGIVAASIAPSIARRKFNSISEKQIDKGKAALGKIAKKTTDKSDSNRTESKRVSDLKSRVTGKKENGKPAFLMTPVEHEQFYARYRQRKNVLVKQRNNATDAASKKRITKQLDRLENDFMSVVEQDFWYADD